MKRSEFLRSTAGWACGACLAAVMGGPAAEAAELPTPVDEALKRARYENEFTNNWLTDLFEAIDTELGWADQMKLLDACGRGCFRRHAFKRDIAAAGKGDLEKLIEAYRRSFSVRRSGDELHIVYGGGKCFCPAARNRPARPNDLHCECTRATHRAIFEEALGRRFEIELVETVRRGGSCCHLIVALA